MIIGRYRLLENFDAYICGIGRIQVGKGAEFELQQYPSNIGPDTYNVYFLNSKNYLPFEAVATFLSCKKEPIHEDRRMRLGDIVYYKNTIEELNNEFGLENEEGLER